MTSLKFDNCVSTNQQFDFPHPIQLNENKNYKAALTYFSGWNNIHNITEKNNIFKYSTDGKTYQEIKLIPGAYDITDINSELQRQMKQNGDYNEKTKSYPITLEIFKMGSKVVLNITDELYTVDFNIPERSSSEQSSSLADLLGFAKIKYRKGYNIAEFTANIINIQTIHIDCDLIESSYIVGKDHETLEQSSKAYADTTEVLKRPVIYSFPAFQTSVGSRIIEKPYSPRFYNVHKKYVDSVRIHIYDNNGNDINFNGEEYSIEIYIKEA